MSEKPSYEELEQKIKDLEKQVADKEALQTEDSANTTAATLKAKAGV